MTTRYMLVQVEIGDAEDVSYIPGTEDWADYKELYRRISILSSGTAFVRASFELTDDGLRSNHELVVRTRQ